MRLVSVETAPVEAVGGTRPTGPWPDDLDEISVGETVTQTVTRDDGSTTEREVTITAISQIVQSDGTETDGYTVSHTRAGEQ